MYYMHSFNNMSFTNTALPLLSHYNNNYAA